VRVPVHRIAAISAVLLLLGFLGTACHHTNPVGPTVPLNQRFVVAPGQIAAIEGTAIRVQFVEVVNDSRCPIDATCIRTAMPCSRYRSSTTVVQADTISTPTIQTTSA